MGNISHFCHCLTCQHLHYYCRSDPMQYYDKTVYPTCSGVVVFRRRTRLPSSEYTFIKCSRILSIPRPSAVIRSPSVLNRLRNISVSYSRSGLAILTLDYNDDRVFKWWNIHSCLTNSPVLTILRFRKFIICLELRRRRNPHMCMRLFYIS